jgi:plastocyanin
MRSRLHLGTCGALALLLFSAAVSAQTTHQVSIYDFGYNPPVLFIEPGDSVLITNTGALFHTATEGDLFTGDVAFRASLSAGQSQLVTFDAALIASFPRLCNSYEYFCEPHPTMSGRIVIGHGESFGSSYCSPNANSTGAGAVFCVNGSAVLADSDLNFSVGDLPQNKFGYFLMSRGTAFLPAFGGSQGILCVGSPLYRFAGDVLNSGTTGMFQFSPDLGNLPQGQVFLPGESWFFQAWYRDNNPGNTSNTTNAIAISFQ